MHNADLLIRNALAKYRQHYGHKIIEAATSDQMIALEESAVKIDAELSGGLNTFGLRT